MLRSAMQLIYCVMPCYDRSVVGPTVVIEKPLFLDTLG